MIRQAEIGKVGGSTAIRVNDLGKCYHMYDEPIDRLRQAIFRGRRKYYNEFWALRNVSFEIRQGEAFGIVGRNGSGKSTLLQLICGTLSPTEGAVEVTGRVAALLELGSGFNPDFTGLENIFLNASLFGLSREDVNTCLENIIGFADIGDFLDQPVKTYSSGMVVRLAFSVLAHVNPSILIVDEALSVGDIFFQQKCYRKIREGLDSGLTLLFVSHDEATLKSFCRSGLLLRQGCCDYTGNIEECTRLYLNSARSGASDREMSALLAQTASSQRMGSTLRQACTITVSEAKCTNRDLGSGKATITDFCYMTADGKHHLNFIDANDPIIFHIKIKANTALRNPCFGYMLKNSNGLCVFSVESDSLLLSIESLPALEAETHYLLQMSFQLPPLKSGEYTVDLALADGLGVNHQQCHWTYDSHVFSVVNPNLCNGCVGSRSTTFSMASIPTSNSTTTS
ncbi:MAG: ABC transporter ATP-binding protein [Cyanobacteria bacterium]|nr:ABC transporter ATP-binding protein [Cyanobacteria bacterium bin.275]